MTVRWKPVIAEKVREMEGAGDARNRASPVSDGDQGADWLENGNTADERVADELLAALVSEAARGRTSG